MKRLLSVAVVAALLVPGACSAAHSSPSPRTGSLAVTGYALGGTSDAVIAASADALTTVTVDGVSISADGKRVQVPDASLAAVRRRVSAHGLRTELLVSNFSNKLGDFDTRAGHRLLSSRANVRHLATRMAAFVARGRYDGVNIDLELVQRRDAGGLVRLARALQRAMPAAKTVSVDISAATSVAQYRDQGYALEPLAIAVDLVQLMAYDQHGPTWSGPGPIGALGWQKRSLAALLRVVPAGKVDLGQAGYGYTWPVRGTGHDVTDARARALVRNDGATAVWHADVGEWSAALSNGTRLWWADARSYAIRTTYAASQHLHGLAVWVLGSADPLR